MSKSADIVARSLLNTHHVSVKLGVLKFRVYQPFVKDLARAFAGGKIDVSISGRQNIPWKQYPSCFSALMVPKTIPVVRQAVCHL